MALRRPSTIRWTKEITNSQVLHLIRAEPDVSKALLLFDAATAELYPTGFRHDHDTFALMSSRLAAAGLLPDAVSILARVPPELDRPPDEPAFLSLLRAYGRAHRPLDALRLFLDAPDTFRLCPSHRSYTSLLAILVSERRLDLARRLYRHMRASGVPPTVASYNVLLKALCTDAGSGVNVNAALRLLREMPGRGCPPDSCSYNTLIDGLCKQGKVGEANELFNEMANNNCMPTVVTYTSLIHGLCCANSLDKAFKLFDEMGKRGIKPNVVTYSALLNGMCKGGQSLKALTLVDRMVSDRCPMNAITYSSLINGLCKEGKLREAVEILDRMRLQGRKPDAGLYGKLIKGLCTTGQFHEAANYLDEMALSGILPNRVTWSLHLRIHKMVIEGLCEKGDCNRGFQVHQSMRTRGISTDPETFHKLVSCYCSKGDVHKAVGIVTQMLLENCIPTRDIWDTIIAGYWDRKKVREVAFSLLDKLMVSCSLESH